MIVLVHQENTARNKAFHNDEIIELSSGTTYEHLVYLARKYPKEWIGWCDEEKSKAQWGEFFEKKPTYFTVLSKGSSPCFLHSGIGYVEDSPYINFKLNSWYPTWIMSPQMGLIHSSLILLSPFYKTTDNFAYDINLFTRSVQNQGVFCYSNFQKGLIENRKESSVLLYRFISETQKKRWVLFLFMCHFIFEKRVSFLAFVKALSSTVIHIKIDVKNLQKTSLLNNITSDYDVIIPTMGRANYLYDVLKDISQQSILPEKVIIVEQDADKTTSTQLNYLKEEQWPFQIVHKFIHQTGACNARNIALKEITATWVLFFDDDVRCKPTLMESIFISLDQTRSKSINLCCLQKGEEEHQKTYKQWSYFGSGCAIVYRDVARTCSFDMKLEHGYGEDVDYGMQIRNAGFDIIYTPQIQILHLKAPIGGFRKPVSFLWDHEKIKPKPSPQIMYFRKKNFTKTQLKGYQLVLFFKGYRNASSKNPISYIRSFKKAWSLSEYYANKL